jgi:hypothetical protein
MPDRSRKQRGNQGPSTHPVDEGIEGAIFDENDTDRENREADVRDLDAAARGESRIASRSGETEDSGGRVRDTDEDSGEESPPDPRPS